MSDVMCFVPCPHGADAAERTCGRAVRIAATGVAFAAGGRPSGLQWLSCLYHIIYVPVRLVAARCVGGGGMEWGVLSDKMIFPISGGSWGIFLWCEVGVVRCFFYIYLPPCAVGNGCFCLARRSAKGGFA